MHEMNNGSYFQRLMDKDSFDFHTEMSYNMCLYNYIFHFYFFIEIKYFLV